MQWMPLKLDLLPAISIETEKTIELYRSKSQCLCRNLVGSGQGRQSATNKITRVKRTGIGESS